MPTMAEKPESKPIYNNLRQVRQFERIAACINGGQSGCSCYSDQATKITEVSQDLCRQYATNGLPFNPYKEPDSERQSSLSGDGQAGYGQSASVLSLGGQGKQNLAYAESQNMAQ